ncbi:MAG: hypothetical protein HC927_10910, partial [Deltaproteobacteria bacterium]|nr:hypothetical protein [Deltaproteobacteria bacterium]
MPLRRKASYADVLGAPEHMIAEIIFGELHLQPPPREPHAAAASALGEELAALETVPLDKDTIVVPVPDTSKPGEVTPTYKFRQETFAVSSASQSPARVIYWTEKGFDGPLINIPIGRIVRVNPVFN